MSNKEIKNCVSKAVSFLSQVSVPEKGFGIKRCSSWHDVSKYPDMMLPATYNATNALVLVKAYNKIKDEEKASIGNFINSFQTKSGAYRFKKMKEQDIYKVAKMEDTWEYIDFHITNYCMGALCNLGLKAKHKFSFTDKYSNLDALKKWFAARDMHDPWLEGNNIVNLASFFIRQYEETDDQNYLELLGYMLEWHNKNQDPQTGYWGTNLKDKPASKLFGMAGAAHNYHIYFYLDEEIPYHEKVIDYCIDFVKAGVQSACIDIDVVDVLANFTKYNYRKQEILDSLEKLLGQLIAFQNPDGGFPDVHTGIRRMDGWVNGYWEPQGYSNCFATWFRLGTIGMIDCVLNPANCKNWKFRNTIGIGYFKPDYLS